MCIAKTNQKILKLLFNRCLFGGIICILLKTSNPCCTAKVKQHEKNIMAILEECSSP